MLKRLDIDLDRDLQTRSKTKSKVTHKKETSRAYREDTEHCYRKRGEGKI